MKTKEESNAIKQKFDSLNKEIQELSEEEILQITGGKGIVLVSYLEGDIDIE